MSPLARALAGSPLHRPSVAVVVVVACAVLIAIALRAHLGTVLTQPVDAVAVYAGALLAASVASLPVLGLCWYLDRRERELPWLYAAVIAWSGFVATGLAFIVNGLLDAALAARFAGSTAVEQLAAETGFTPQDLALLATVIVAGPLAEELLKGLALLALFWLLRNEFHGVRDGLVYGALVGLGFNVFETAFYVLNGFLDTGTAPLGQQLVVRFVFLGLNGHVVFSAILGAALGLARQTPRRWLKVAVPLGGLFLAIIAHQATNLLEGPLIAIWLALNGVAAASFGQVSLPALWLAAVFANLIILTLPLGLLALAVAWSSRWERRTIREGLGDEIGGSITPAEHALLLRESPFGLRTVPGYPRRVARGILRAQNELAFRKWRVRRDGGDPSADPVVAAWRADIARLRATPGP